MGSGRTSVKRDTTCPCIWKGAAGASHRAARLEPAAQRSTMVLSHGWLNSRSAASISFGAWLAGWARSNKSIKTGSIPGSKIIRGQRKDILVGRTPPCLEKVVRKKLSRRPPRVTWVERALNEGPGTGLRCSVGALEVSECWFEVLAMRCAHRTGAQMHGTVDPEKKNITFQAITPP